MASEPVVEIGYTGNTCPEPFNTIPKQTKDRKPGQLNDDQLKQFFDEGYLVVENFFTHDELDPCKDAVGDLVEELAQKLYNAGKIKKLYGEFGLFQRLTEIDKEFPGANVILHKTGKLPKAFQDLWSNERILNLVEQLIGPDIAGSPVWNLRTKTPKNEVTNVPWHQDCAYFDNKSYGVLIPTAWIPFIDTDENNGCLQVVKRGHKKGLVAKHSCCAGPTWYVMLEEDEMTKSLDVDMDEDTVTCPVPYGGFVLFNNLTPHRSLANYSTNIRYSIDLRWQRPDQPYGLWDLKDGVVMRSSTDPNLKINWDDFIKVDRTTLQAEKVDKVEDEFDTALCGPWMSKWEIVHHNKHTAKAKALGKLQR